MFSKVNAVNITSVFNIAPAVLTAALLVSPASASTVVTYQDASVFGDSGIYAPVQISTPDIGGVYAGPFQVTGTDGVGDFLAFCVDLAQHMSSGNVYEYGVDLFSSAVVENLDKLFTSAFAGVDTNVEGAAFQVAIWEIITDTGSALDLGVGSFIASDPYDDGQDVIGLASSYLAGLGTETGGYMLTFLSSDQGQDLVTATPSPVPLPAAGLMLGFGMASLVAMRRKRKPA